MFHYILCISKQLLNTFYVFNYLNVNQGLQCAPSSVIMHKSSTVALPFDYN